MIIKKKGMTVTKNQVFSNLSSNWANTRFWRHIFCTRWQDFMYKRDKTKNKTKVRERDRRLCQIDIEILKFQSGSKKKNTCQIRLNACQIFFVICIRRLCCSSQKFWKGVELQTLKINIKLIIINIINN